MTLSETVVGECDATGAVGGGVSPGVGETGVGVEDASDGVDDDAGASWSAEADGVGVKEEDRDDVLDLTLLEPDDPRGSDLAVGDERGSGVIPGSTIAGPVGVGTLVMTGVDAGPGVGAGSTCLPAGSE